MYRTCRSCIIFCVGASVYPLLEIISRGYTHWSMGLAGGMAFLSICGINRTFQQKAMWFKCMLGSVSITAIEFVIGCVVNIQYHLNVWDYSHMPVNLLGQVCLPFTLLWFFLCIPALKIGAFLDRVLEKLANRILEGRRQTALQAHK